MLAWLQLEQSTHRMQPHSLGDQGFRVYWVGGHSRAAAEPTSHPEAPGELTAHKARQQQRRNAYDLQQHVLIRDRTWNRSRARVTHGAMQGVRA